MADQNPMDCADTPAVHDAKTESAVLALLVDEHPIRLTVDELSLVLNADPELENPDDAAERAVHELVGAGLIHRDGRFLTPTRAALYFFRLQVA